MTTKPGQQRSRLDPEPIPRRDLLGLSSLAAAGTACAVAAVGMLRLPKAAVLPSPSKRFTVTLPESLGSGEPLIPPGRQVVVYRDPEGVYAISLVCTHLACIVKVGGEGFECPCHGSRFAADGAVTKGPAPQALPWLKVAAKGGRIVIDEDETVPAGTKVNV
ncbi:MAG: ubiquinol-cytochrome c reductase iron-sulfur subunit [Pirellulales bacterium]